MTAPEPRKTAFPWKTHLGITLAIMFVALLPLILVAIMSGIAMLAGCEVTAARAHPCLLIGVDFGGLLYGIGIVGWVTVLFVPLGAIAMLCWGVVWGVHYLLHRGRG